jgi:hypothetical protein
VFYQVAEHREGFGRERNQLPATPQPRILRVEMKLIEAKYLSCLHFPLTQI